MSRTHLAVLALVTVFVAAGCGSSSKSTGGTATAAHTSASAPQTQISSSQSTNDMPLTQAQLIAQADPICARVNGMFKATVVTTHHDYITKFPPLASAKRAEANQLAQLTPPKSMAKDWKLMVHSMRVISSDMIKLATYADARNFTRANELLAKGNVTRERLVKTATRNGFKECSA